MPLPLFPLPVVLFPGALMPLHIFEPRYRVMLADCVEGDHRFGLLAASEDEPAPTPGAVGALARVRAVQPLPEGRSNIVVSGDGRFVLERILPSEKPYLVGEVAELVDLPDVEVPRAEQMAVLRKLGERYGAALGVLNDVEREPDFSDDPAVLTFQVAALLEWDLAQKRHFLSVRSPLERVTRLLHAVPALLREVESRAQVHRRAVGNGAGARSG
jgi:Lon protease-like protein